MFQNLPPCSFDLIFRQLSRNNSIKGIDHLTWLDVFNWESNFRFLKRVQKQKKLVNWIENWKTEKLKNVLICWSWNWNGQALLEKEADSSWWCQSQILIFFSDKCLFGEFVGGVTSTFWRMKSSKLFQKL